jgi:hypothetical protein
MLKEVTSLFDYFKKAEADKQYELIGIYSYIEDGYNPAPYTFESVKAWIEKWVKDTVGQGYEETCRGMVDYLNRTIRRMEDPGHRGRLERKLANAVAAYEAEQAYNKIEQARLEQARQQAQMTNTPIITAQQIRPIDWTQVTLDTPITFRTTNYTINPAYYGTVTIDNGIQQIRRNTITPVEQTQPEPPAATPQPPIENLWGDIPEPLTHPDNPTGQTPPTPPLAAPTTGPGTMTEYGWYDQEIEREIQSYMARLGIPREDAIIRVFNECGDTQPPTAAQAATPPVRNENRWADVADDFDFEEITFDYPEDDPREER